MGEPLIGLGMTQFHQFQFGDMELFTRGNAVVWVLKKSAMVFVGESS